MDLIVIPVELCKYTLMNHKVSQVRLFIYLKTICSGQIKLTDETIKRICLELNYKTPKTFKVHLRWLVKHKWIYINGNTDYYKIKGFLPIAKKLHFCCIRGAIFEPLDFSKFKAFLIAAVITYFMYYKGRNEGLSACLTGRTNMHSLFPASYSLPHLYLAKVLKISKTQAATYRDLAIKAGFIVVKPKFKKIEIPLREAKNYKKYATSEKQHFRIINKVLYEQINDELFSGVFLKTKNNLKKKLKNRGNFPYR